MTHVAFLFPISELLCRALLAAGDDLLRVAFEFFGKLIVRIRRRHRAEFAGGFVQHAGMRQQNPADKVFLRMSTLELLELTTLLFIQYPEAALNKIERGLLE